MPTNPYAAYGGQVAGGGNTDPYSAYGGQMSMPKMLPTSSTQSVRSTPTPLPGLGKVEAYTPSLWERAKNVVGNSAIGHALEQGLPHVADTLGLHPTETVNSPTYQQDKGQLIAPQYLTPAPSSTAGHFARGVLNGVGQLTGAKNIATGAGIAATTGLAAPLAAGAGIAGTLARLGGVGARAGLTAVGAKGVYDDARHAIHQYNAGDTAGAAESMGAVLPNAALTLPALGEPLQAVGEASQRGGVGILNRTVGARKADFARGANPGDAYFAAGLGPSASMDSIAAKASNALKATGQKIGATSEAFQNSGGLIPYAEGAAPIRDAIAKARAAQSGPGGTGSTDALDAFESTWKPLLDDAEKRGGFLPQEYAAAKRNTAQNTTWGDPTQAGMKQARQQVVGGMGGALVGAMPELGPLNKQYQGLSKLAPLAQYRADTGSVPMSRLVDKGLLGLTGAGAGAMSHDPLVSVAAGLGSAAMDSVPVRTTAASALYYGGEGLKRVGAGLTALPSLLSGSKNKQGLQNDEGQTNYSTQQQPAQYGAQSNPQSAPYSLRNLTPEIINPASMPYSKVGVGTDGRAGVLNRVRGMLPAPSEPPAPTTYSRQNIAPEIIRPGQMSQSRVGVGTNGRSGLLLRMRGLLPADTTLPAQENQPGQVRAPYVAPSRPQSSLLGKLAGNRQLDATPAGIEGVDGGATQVLTPNGSVPGRYRVVEGDKLIPSHDPFTFAPNAKYPAGIQERDYQNSRENQARVIQNAQNYKPELTVTDNPDGANGPPVVTPNGVVLGGNSRLMSLAHLYDRDPSAYKNMLASKAGSFGLDANELQGMKKPVLVREVQPEGGAEGMRRFGSDLNRSLTGSMGGSERAVSLGKNLSPSTLNAVQSMMDDSGATSLRELLSDPTRSNAFLKRLQSDGVITSQERPQYVDTGDGSMSEEGKRLFERALLGSAIGDSSVMDQAPKSVLNKLSASIGPLSSLASRGDTWNISEALREAIQAHAQAASSGMSINDLLNQRTLGKGFSPQAEQLARVLASKPAAVREAFAEYAKDARQSPEGQVKFLGPTAEDAFAYAFGEPTGGKR